MRRNAAVGPPQALPSTRCREAPTSWTRSSLGRQPGYSRAGTRLRRLVAWMVGAEWRCRSARGGCDGRLAQHGSFQRSGELWFRWRSSLPYGGTPSPGLWRGETGVIARRVTEAWRNSVGVGVNRTFVSSNEVQGTPAPQSHAAATDRLPRCRAEAANRRGTPLC